MRPPYDAVLNELEHARTERARFAKERDEALAALREIRMCSDDDRVLRLAKAALDKQS